MPRIWFNALGVKTPTKRIVHGTDETRLDEDMAAGSTTSLWYPNVGTCATFTVATRTRIAGTHVSTATSLPTLKALFAHVVAEAGRDPITAVYLAGNSLQWATGASPMGTTPAAFVKFARTELGKYKGNVYYIDTKDVIEPPEREQAFIQVTYSGTAGAIVEAMSQVRLLLPSEEERQRLKVVPPGKLVSIK